MVNTDVDTVVIQLEEARGGNIEPIDVRRRGRCFDQFLPYHVIIHERLYIHFDVLKLVDYIFNYRVAHRNKNNLFIHKLINLVVIPITLLIIRLK